MAMHMSSMDTHMRYRHTSRGLYACTHVRMHPRAHAPTCAWTHVRMHPRPLAPWPNPRAGLYAALAGLLVAEKA